MGFNWQTLIGIVTTIAGAGIAAKIFWSAQMYERGGWFRLGKPIYKKSKSGGKAFRVLLPGRPGVSIPFVVKLIKIFVGIRVRETQDMEMMRFDPEHNERQAWVCKAEINFRVQTGRERLKRAMTRAEDLNTATMSHIQAAIKQALYEYEVGTLETSLDIYRVVKQLTKADLNGLGVALTKVNVYKLRQVDATILANALKDRKPEFELKNGEPSKESITGVLWRILHP